MSAKPKALLFGDDLAAVERQIVDALPDIVSRLIEKAKKGDTKASVYLCDRILGRVAGLALPPAEDRRAPYSEGDFESEEAERRETEDLFRTLGMTGARNGA